MNDELIRYLETIWMVKRGNEVVFFQGELEDLPPNLMIVVC
jgi:hypothetical protein